MVKRKKILLSACLAGVNCTYNGKNKLNPYLKRLFDERSAVLFCPEKLGGFDVPHPPSEILFGDGMDVLKGNAVVVSRTGKNVTVLFMEGAKRSMRLAKKLGIKKAVMKARSPSCGCGMIYDGLFKGRLKKGFGVTAALLKKNGIEVITDEEYLRNNKLQITNAK
ncbi:MAG TPA: DUF523 domain-containing protein [Candidatus Omnitrophota bacterium]|nr:DUF523 domain-containing protein [Candidatus Omnitrophota bacterium]